MSKIRHWQQRFDMSAKLVFLTRRKFAMSETGFMEPGQEISDEMKASLGRHRLKMWWRAGWIGLADFVDKRTLQRRSLNADPVPAQPDPVSAQETAGSVKHLGGGWYDVTLPNGSVDRVHGKVSAQLLLDSYDG